MKSIDDILILYVFLSALVSLGLLLWGIRQLWQYRLKREITDAHLTETECSILMQGVSIAVYGYGREQEIDTLLDQTYSKFDLIFVTDLTEYNSQDWIRRYDLHQKQHTTTHELHDCTLRGVYTSGNPAYRKLIVVDKPMADKADVFNCAVEVSTHDKIIFLDHFTTLNRNALSVLMFGLSQDDSLIHYGVVALKRVPPRRYILGKIDSLYRLADRGVAWETFGIGWGYKEISVLFERESIVAVGGFSAEVNEDRQMLVKIRQSILLEEYEQRPIALFIPEMISFSTDKTSSRWVNTHFSRVFALMSLCAVALWTLVVATGRLHHETIQWPLWITAAVYLWVCAVCEAVISISNTWDMAFPKLSSGRLWALYIGSVVHPLCRVGRFISGRNFIKSE